MVGAGGSTEVRPDTSREPVRLIIMSQRRLLRESLAAAVGTEAMVVGHAVWTDEAVLLCRLCRPDLLIMDIGSGADPGVRTRVSELAELTRIIVVYECLSPTEVSLLRRQGVEAQVPMSRGLDTLLERVRATEPGGRVRPTAGRAGELTTLERRILHHLSDGSTAGTLARSLGVSEAAVANAKRRVYRKMNVASQSQAVALARALRIVTFPASREVSTDAAQARPALTPREEDILRSIAMGHTVRQTARHLGIAAKTVENTQARLFWKLGASNRVTALAAAYDRGLVELTDPVRQPEPPGGPA